MNPFALGLFNFVLLTLGIQQLSWLIGLVFPSVAGATTRNIIAYGLNQYLVALVLMCVVACLYAAFSRGVRWRAFAIALLLVNNLALATFSVAVMGSVTSVTWNSATDMLLAAYLGLIMAVRAHDHQFNT